MSGRPARVGVGSCMYQCDTRGRHVGPNDAPCFRLQRGVNLDLFAAADDDAMKCALAPLVTCCRREYAAG